MKRLKLTVLAILALFCTGIKAGAETEESVRYASLNVSDGLSQISVMKIMQDSKGFMWFATRNGLNRYDGTEFKVYQRKYDEPGGISDNQVNCLTEDNNGFIWAGAGRGLNKLDISTGQVTVFSAETGYPEMNKVISAISCCRDNRILIGAEDGLYMYQEDGVFSKICTNSPLDGKNIQGIEQLNNGDYIVSTEKDGVVVFSPDFSRFRQYHTQDGSLPTNLANKIYKASNGTIWLGGNTGGVVRFDPVSGESKWFTKENSGLSTDNVRCFADDGNTLFIGTIEGIFYTDITGNEPIKFEKNNLSNFSVYTITMDKSGTRWVGTYSGGVNYYHPSLDRLSILCPKAPNQDYPSIFGAMAASEDKLYIATEGSGLIEYDPGKKESRYYQIVSPYLHHASNIIKSLTYHNGLLYCGTGNGEVFTLDPASKQFKRRLKTEASSIYSIIPEDDGTIWIATSKDSLGLIKAKDGEQKYRYGKARISVPSSRVLAKMDESNLLIGTRRYGLIKYNMDLDTLVIAGGQALSGAYVTSICKNGDSDIYYIGTYGQGVFSYDASTNKAKKVKFSTEIASGEVFQIVQDKELNLWLSTHKGIVKYNPSTEEQILFRRSSDVDIQEFSLHSGTCTPDGFVGFSGSNGFVFFHPEGIAINTFIPPLAFTEFRVNNKERTDLGIDDVQNLTLNYDENNIAISFVALNYINPENNRYSYRLKGMDDEWTKVGTRHNAVYTNLAPGKYCFEVKCSNSDGLWNEEARSINLTIQPPIWKRWWAILFYILTTLAVAGTVLYYVYNKNKLEQSLRFEQQKQRQAEEFHQSRLRMFTNLSHELRTPLLLIMSPVKEMLKQGDMGPQEQNKLRLIQDNSQRMLTLVNQLMDLNKNESGQMKIKVEKDDIAAFLKEIYYAFDQLAEPKGVKLEFSSSEEAIPAIIDKSAIEKVAFNLLSNAIKFTQPGGKVSISVNQTTNSDAQNALGQCIKALKPDTSLIHICVADGGKGIPEDKLKDIFTAFYQVEDGKAKEVEGSGIGLSLTESIVLLHHGIIWAESGEGKGSIFNILLPNDISVYQEEEISQEAPWHKVGEVIPPTEVLEPLPDEEKRHTVLLVEDNEEVRNYVKKYLEPYYFVLEADNGKDAFDIVVDKNPNIVISDIMMPVKNGLELCSEIKKDSRTGHIPVILMTARSMVMQIKEGFATGADDYIVKPFDMDLLLYRVRNILQSRDKLRNFYGKSFSPEAMGIEMVSGNEKFTTKFFEVVEKNIDNPNLDIQMLCNEIGLSRANLYRKLKSISNLSPMELVRNKRLEIAAKLLLESDYSISEIASYTGFNSHPYFTSCFKTLYGQTPSEYIESHSNNKS